METPVNKVVFIQKIASFTPLSLDGIIKLAYVNRSWADTIKNYGAHVVEERVRSAGTVDDTYTKALVCALEGDIIWLFNVLLSKSCLNRINLPHLLCKSSSTAPATAKFVLDKITEVGGNEILRNQLAKKTGDGETCLMTGCSYSLSPEVMKLVLEKIEEVGGKEFLKTQLTAIDYDGRNVLMFGCVYCSSVEVMKLIFQKIVEAGGRDLLKHQVSAIDKLGQNCLMRGCSCSTSAAVMKLVFEKIVEAGGPELLSSQLADTDDYGRTCLGLSSRNCASPEVVKLVASGLHHFGIFAQQYAKLEEADKETLKKNADIEDASWAPDPASAAEVNEMLKR